VPQFAQMTQGHYDDEDWALPVSIAALVKGDTPAEAGRDSQRIAAAARGAALGAKTAANADGAEITDIVSTSL
jgi:hypothetical protein